MRIFLLCFVEKFHFFRSSFPHIIIICNYLGSGRKVLHHIYIFETVESFDMLILLQLNNFMIWRRKENKHNGWVSSEFTFFYSHYYHSENSSWELFLYTNIIWLRLKPFHTSIVWSMRDMFVDLVIGTFLRNYFLFLAIFSRFNFRIKRFRICIPFMMIISK